MLKRLLLAALLSIGITAFAQPTITSSINPQPGNTYVYYRCDSIGPGAAGSNITWQFFAMSNNGSTTTTYSGCPEAPDCSLFGGSDLAMVSGQYSGAYYIADNNRFAMNGERPNSNNTFVYSDPKDVRRYPFTMGSSYTDTHRSLYDLGLDFTRKGTLTSTVDGYGTLMLPTTSYTSTLRVHYTDVYTDSSHVSSGFDQDYMSDVYEWYTPGYNEYLMRIERLYIYPSSTVTDTIIVNKVVYTKQFPNDVKEISSANGITIYPVPAHDKLNIDLGGIAAQSIELTDIVGKTIQRVNYANGISNYQMNTADVPTGIYIIRIDTDNGVITKKVEIL